MTEPVDELVRHVMEALSAYRTEPYGDLVLGPSRAAAITLHAVPDGYAKIDGEWVRLAKSDSVRLGGPELDGVWADRYRVLGKDRQ